MIKGPEDDMSMMNPQEESFMRSGLGVVGGAGQCTTTTSAESFMAQCHVAGLGSMAGFSGMDGTRMENKTILNMTDLSALMSPMMRQMRVSHIIHSFNFFTNLELLFNAFTSFVWPLGPPKY